MRLRRLKAPPGWDKGYYHCTSRIVDQQFLFQEAEKRYFEGLIREYELFCGVKVLTYNILSNHFHIVVEVPTRPKELPSAQDVLVRLEALSGQCGAAEARQRYEALLKAGDEQAIQAWLEGYYRRMWDLSEYMKLIKQRFSQWYNRCKKRTGTLWAARFWSVLVQPGQALKAVGLYTDLNAVRAQITPEPEKYAWGGYARAMAGDAQARLGIQRLVQGISGSEQLEQWEQALSTYRVWLYERGDQEQSGVDSQGRPLRAGIDRAKVLEVLNNHGKVNSATMAMCRVRYFTHGGAIGSREFIEKIFHAYRERFGKKRKSGARRIRGLLEELYSLRDLRVNRFG